MEMPEKALHEPGRGWGRAGPAVDQPVIVTEGWVAAFGALGLAV